MIPAFVVAMALTPQSASPATVRELERIEQQLGSTYTSGDCAGWAALLADEWSVIHIDGTVIPKTEAVAMCKKPPVPITTYKIDDVSVRAYGSSAVVTGRTTVAFGGATPGTLALRFTDVFIRRNNRWVVVASHATQITP
jgi:uncharacterized protein DUF4440